MRSPLRPRQLPLCSIRLLTHAYSEARPGDLIHQISGNKTSARSPPSCRAAECASYPLYALSAARVNAGGCSHAVIKGHRPPAHLGVLGVPVVLEKFWSDIPDLR